MSETEPMTTKDSAMGDPDKAAAAAWRGMTTRYLCPISGCEWYHDSPDVPDGPWPWKGLIEDTVYAVAMDRAQAVDRTISAHLITHPVLDWFKEVREQQNRADRAEAELDARIVAESADAAAGSYAGRAERAEAALAEMRERLGKTGEQWGVRTRDDDPDEDIEVVSSEAIAREFASTWRSEIPDANPTAMVRTRCEPGPWRVADATPRTALKRAADEQGDGEGGGA